MAGRAVRAGLAGFPQQHLTSMQERLLREAAGTAGVAIATDHLSLEMLSELRYVYLESVRRSLGRNVYRATDVGRRWIRDRDEKKGRR